MIALKAICLGGLSDLDDHAGCREVSLVTSRPVYSGSNCLITGVVILSFASKSDDANGTYKPALQAFGAANLQD